MGAYSANTCINTNKSKEKPLSKKHKETNSTYISTNIELPEEQLIQDMKGQINKRYAKMTNHINVEQERIIQKKNDQTCGESKDVVVALETKEATTSKYTRKETETEKKAKTTEFTVNKHLEEGPIIEGTQETEKHH